MNSVRIVIDLQKTAKIVTQFLYILHVAFPNISYSTLVAINEPIICIIN